MKGGVKCKRMIVIRIRQNDGMYYVYEGAGDVQYVHTGMLIIGIVL